MSGNFEDIPTLEGAGRIGRRAVSDSAVADAYRLVRPEAGPPISSFGLAIGLRAVRLLQDRVFPSGSDIVAMGGTAGPDYTTHSDCSVFQYNGTCNEAFWGFDPAHMDPFYCATCDEQNADPVNNPFWNWHFVGSRGSIQYIDMEPDACYGKDAWKWSVGACGDCSDSAVFRCHDGYKKYPNAASWDPTICQGMISCDGELKLCE
jgi:hypothetical protein